MHIAGVLVATEKHILFTPSAAPECSQIPENTNADCHVGNGEQVP